MSPKIVATNCRTTEAGIWFDAEYVGYAVMDIPRHMQFHLAYSCGEPVRADERPHWILLREAPDRVVLVRAALNYLDTMPCDVFVVPSCVPENVRVPALPDTLPPECWAMVHDLHIARGGGSAKPARG